MFPMISRMAASTPSSMRNETSNDPIAETTNTSRGKYTFLIRLALPMSEPIDAFMLFEM